MEHDDLERRLRRFRAKEPPAAVRDGLLSRAQDEVAARRSGGRGAGRLRLAVAAAVMLAVATDFAANHVTDARIAALSGGPVIVRRDGAAIASALRERARMLSMSDHERGWE
jgi:hypothetical protein